MKEYRSVMEWVWRVIPAYRELERSLERTLATNQETQKQIVALAQLKEALERKCAEVTTERDSWQKQALDWQQRYSEKDADLVNVLKRSADALYIKATGMSMYGAAEPVPSQQVDMEKIMSGQRPTQAEIRQKAQMEVARKAMEYLKMNGGISTDPAIAKTGDELVEFFKSEQEQFNKPQ